MRGLAGPGCRFVGCRGALLFGHAADSFGPVVSAASESGSCCFVGPLEAAVAAIVAGPRIVGPAEAAADSRVDLGTVGCGPSVGWCPRWPSDRSCCCWPPARPGPCFVGPATGAACSHCSIEAGSAVIVGAVWRSSVACFAPPGPPASRRLAEAGQSYLAAAQEAAFWRDPVRSPVPAEEGLEPLAARPFAEAVPSPLPDTGVGPDCWPFAAIGPR